MTHYVYVVARITAKPGHESNLGPALLGLVEIARTEPGFIRYDLHVSVDSDAEFVFYEIWESEELLDAHNNSESMKTFGAKAGGLIEGVEIKKFRKIS